MDAEQALPDGFEPTLPSPTEAQRDAFDAVAEHVRALNEALERANDADLRCWVDVMPVTISGRRWPRPVVRITVSAPVEVS